MEGNGSRAVQTSCENGQLCREVKQEDKDEANLAGRHRLVSENQGKSPKMHVVKTECDDLVENAESLKRMKKKVVGCWRNRFTGGQREEFEGIAIQEQTSREEENNPCYKPIVSHPRPADIFRFPDGGESFDCKESKLIAHPKMYTEKPYRCLLYEKSFSQSSHLTSHQQHHVGKEPYWDGDLGQSIHLLSHQRFHAGKLMCRNSSSLESFPLKYTRCRNQCTGRNLHHCAECGKSFQYPSQLIRHQRVHTGEKPYQCTECGKRFSQCYHFRDHWKLHTGENPYQCLTCGKSFSYVSQFRVHQRSHTGEKPYHCPNCAQCFYQRAHLLRHQKKIHGSGEKYPC